MILPPMPILIAAGALAAVLAGSAAGWSARRVIADRDIAELQAAQAQERERHADAALAAEAQARATEARRVEELGRIEHDAAKRTAAVQADAGRARAAADLLRQHVARLAASGGSAPGDPAAAPSGEAATGPGLVLAELFGRADDRAGELASWADAAHSAGLACERAYDAVRTP